MPGAGHSQLGDSLATTFPSMYGADAGAHGLSELTNTEVADVYSRIFRREKKEAVQLGLDGPVRTDAQTFATALAVCVTNFTLAGNTVTDHGFLITANGVGNPAFNAGDNGEVFGVSDGSDVTVPDLLLATDDRAVDGVLYDSGGEADDDRETLFRTLANNVFSNINEQGDT